MTTVGKPWDNQAREHLVRYWQATGSILLTAILMGRTTSAIQTAASRFNLPKRTLYDDSHRRAWSGVDEANWLKAKRELSRRDGRLPLDLIAVRLKRSVDTVVTRLLRDVDGDEARFLDRIVIPDVGDLSAFEKNVKSLAADLPASETDPRKQGKMRKCLSCEKPFWSTGAGNRICNKCKTNGEWD